jgi:hypothetical protein
MDKITIYDTYFSKNNNFFSFDKVDNNTFEFSLRDFGKFW